jgi:hypothetical protein
MAVIPRSTKSLNGYLAGTARMGRARTTVQAFCVTGLDIDTPRNPGRDQVSRGCPDNQWRRR